MYTIGPRRGAPLSNLTQRFAGYYVVLFLLLFLFSINADSQPLISLDKVFDQFSGFVIWHSFQDLKGIDKKFITVPDHYGVELLLGPYPSSPVDALKDSLKAAKLKLNAEQLWIMAHPTNEQEDMTQRKALYQKDSLLDRYYTERIESWGKVQHLQVMQASTNGHMIQSDSTWLIDSMYINSLKTERAKIRFEMVQLKNPTYHWTDQYKKDSELGSYYQSKIDSLDDENIESPRVDNPFQVEFGVGVNFSNSYELNADTFHVKAPVRGITLAVYLEPPWGDRVKDGFAKFLADYWYLGVVVGNYSLINPLLNKQSINGETIGFAVEPGKAIKIASSSYIIIEGGYRWLNFNGVQIDNHSLDMSGWIATIGLQLGRK